MKFLRSFILGRYPLAILVGVLWAAAFPNVFVAGLAWVTPGLMLLCAIGERGGRAFRIGYVAGMAHYLASLYWLLLIPVPWAPILGWVALSAFLSLFSGAWVWLAWKLFPVRLTGEGTGPRFQNWAERFLSAPWAGRVVWALSGAALWVAWEMVLARIFGGFPWNLLGSSQFHILPLVQFVSFTGIYGVSFIITWSSLAILSALMVTVRRPAMRSAWVGEIFLPMLVVAALFASGYRKLLRPQVPGPELKIALVQPSIPQTLIWDPKADYFRFEQLIKLSQTALTNKPDLMIWPEAAVPGLLRAYEEISGPIEDLARTNKIWMIIGGDDFQPHPGATKLIDSDFFNSSFLISPEGQIVGNYRKRNLVMFGEYVPLTGWLPFLKFLTPITGSFKAGDRPVPFEMPDLKVNVSVLICFEDVFPQLAREYVFDDTDFLVNLTNNGWFGEGSAQWQHAAAALFRAIENGLPLVRCSNNGLTCWIDSCGRLRDVFRSETHGIYGPGYMIIHVPVLAPGEKRAATYYRLHGDVFGWLCVAFSGLQILKSWMRDRVSSSGKPNAPLSTSSPS